MAEQVSSGPRKPELCYLCGAEATTRDHIPPKQLFEVLPGNIITVPACLNCNKSLGKDEEYFRALLTMECYERSAIAKRIWDSTVVRSLWKAGFPGLRRRLLEQTSLINLPPGVLRTIVVGEGKRVARVIRKMVRGIYFELHGKRISDDEVLIFRDVDARIDLEKSTRRWAEIDMGEVFRCRYQFDNPDGEIWIQFYRANWWYAMIGEPARRAARKNSS